jgi:hypothetical protein
MQHQQQWLYKGIWVVATVALGLGQVSVAKTVKVDGFEKFTENGFTGSGC